MKTTKPFGYPVTEYGLPRDWCTITPTGSENLLDITVQELTATFWLLESIHINFSYSLNQAHKERSLILAPNIEPINRIAQDPVFQYHYHDPHDLESYFALELWSIAHPPHFTGKANLRFSAMERDSDQLFVFTCDEMPNYRLLDQHPFTLLNRNLSMKLWTLSSDWSGHIHYFNIKMEYYCVEET